MILIGPTLGRYFAARFARTVLGVFVTVFALVYTLDVVELLRRAGGDLLVLSRPGAGTTMRVLLRHPQMARRVPVEA